MCEMIKPEDIIVIEDNDISFDDLVEDNDDNN